ncbi:DUF1684 domain-containing protein [Ferruginibacter sp.]
MKKFIFLFTAIFCLQISFAQKSKTYNDSIKAFQKTYVTSHEVVKTADRKFFRFYPADKTYAIQCSFEKSTDTTVVVMKTSGKKIPQKDFIRYGKLIFTIHDTALQLTVYQSKLQTPLTKDYLFIPFADVTSGDETYGSGRNIDLLITDIKNNTALADFNKAYNPYCVYSDGYNCPIPPRENYLVVAIKAGEKTFAKKH